MACSVAIKRHCLKVGFGLGQTCMYGIPDMNNKWKIFIKLTTNITCQHKK